MTHLTAEQAGAISDAMLWELTACMTWEELKDRSFSDACAANQDALIDDLFEQRPEDEPHRAMMIARVKLYDELLGTTRAEELSKI